MSGSSTWLAGTGELQELHDVGGTSQQHQQASRFQPPPPPPTEDEIIQLEAALLENGVYVAVPDPSSGNVFYVDLVTGFRTWAMHAHCQVQFYELRDRLSANTSTNVAAVSEKSRRNKNNATPTKKGNDTLPSPRSTPTSTHAPSLAASTITPAQWRYKIVELYNTHDPSKVQLVDELLGRYYGYEEELWANLQAKYNSPKSSSRDLMKSARTTTVPRDGGGVGPVSPRQQQQQKQQQVAVATAISSPARDAEVYVNEHDLFMHRHHGDTHGVSYRSSSGGSGSSPPSAQRRKPPQPSAEHQSRHSRHNRPQQKRREAPKVELPPDLIDHVATPNVSTIDAESDAEMEEHRRLLAEARAFAEAKAAKVLQHAADHQQQRLKKREAQQRSAQEPAPVPSGVGKQLWSQELSRREEQAAAKRAAINQERERSKARRDEDLRRRAEELKLVREREQLLRSQEAEVVSVRHSTPRRHQDPSTMRSPDSARRRASPMKSNPSPRPRHLDAAASPAGTTNDDMTPSRKLSAREMRSSVERLYAGQRR